MSKYTTGEIAKLCDVSVRTVQYYDDRGILIPSELSEGGRRLYSENDLHKLRIICFLRSIGLSINVIGEILSEEQPEDVIMLLLEQHELQLKEEVKEQQKKLRVLEGLKQELKSVDEFSAQSIGDIANIVKNKNKLSRVRWTMLTVGIMLDIIEIGTLIFWIKTGVWWPFLLGMMVVILGGIWISVYYFKNMAYICPKCHEVFKPTFGKMFWAAHTPKTRKLTCTKCGHKGYCVETYNE